MQKLTFRPVLGPPEPFQYTRQMQIFPWFLTFSHFRPVVVSLSGSTEWTSHLRGLGLAENGQFRLWMIGSTHTNPLLAVHWRGYMAQVPRTVAGSVNRRWWALRSRSNGSLFRLVNASSCVAHGSLLPERLPLE